MSPLKESIEKQNREDPKASKHLTRVLGVFAVFALLVVGQMRHVGI